MAALILTDTHFNRHFSLKQTNLIIAPQIPLTESTVAVQEAEGSGSRKKILLQEAENFTIKSQITALNSYGVVIFITCLQPLQLTPLLRVAETKFVTPLLQTRQN